MKQVHKAKRNPGSAGGRQEPQDVDPRDPDIVRAHQIARRSSRPGAARVGASSHNPAPPVRGR